MIKNKIIAIDYDGTCTKENTFPNVGELRDGLKLCIDELQKNGNTVILWTCRHDESLKEAIKLLNDNGIYFDYYNENSSFKIENYGDCRKIGADCYIDDKNIFMEDINWFHIYRYFKNKDE